MKAAKWLPRRVTEAMAVAGALPRRVTAGASKERAPAEVPAKEAAVTCSRFRHGGGSGSLAGWGVWPAGIVGGRGMWV